MKFETKHRVRTPEVVHFVAVTFYVNKAIMDHTADLYRPLERIWEAILELATRSRQCHP